MTNPIIVDVDTGIDDSLAILYLLGHPRAQVLGFIATAGNVPVDAVTANTLGWLELVGEVVPEATQIPVFRGAGSPLVEPLRTTEDTHGPRGVGYADLPEPTRGASHDDGWAALTSEHPGAVGLVTGPCTNLALAVRADPTLPGRLRRLVIMGGAFHHPGNTTPTAEWNVSVDPESLAEVLHAFAACPGAPQPILCPLDLTETMELTPDHVSQIAALAASVPPELPSTDDPDGTRSQASNPVIAALSDALRFYFEFHRDHDQGYIAHMHDPFAAWLALDPSRAAYRPATVDVELTGTLTRGTTIADYPGHWGRPHNAQIAVAAEPEAFLRDLIDGIGRLAGRVRPSEGAGR